MYADYLTIIHDEPAKPSPSLLETVTEIIDTSFTREDRFNRLCPLLPERYHSELRNVIETHRAPVRLTKYIQARA